MFDIENRKLTNEDINGLLIDTEKTINFLIYSLIHKPTFNDDGFKAIVNIFKSMIINNALKNNKLIIKNKDEFLENIKTEINKIVKIYTNIEL
ncbi:MAG TPA: hypothetical protein PLN85_00905 [archaeon]|nr:hypothetical protein [archaeon]